MKQAYAIVRGVVVLAALTGAACGGAAARSPFAPSPHGPLTRRVAGTVVDTGNRPVGGAVVSLGLTTITESDPEGRFSLALPYDGTSFVNVSAPGFESGRWGLTATAGADIRIRIARQVFVTPGEPLTVALTTDDLSYYVGEPYESDYCRPCQLIRLGDSDSPSRVRRVHLRWTSDVVLGMWASEGRSGLAAEVVGPGHLSVATIGVGGNRLLYVGVPLGHDLAGPITFSLTVD